MTMGPGMRDKLKMDSATERESSITRQGVFMMVSGKRGRSMVLVLCTMRVVILLIMVSGRTRCLTVEVSYTTITPSPTRSSSTMTSATSRRCGSNIRAISNMTPRMVSEPCTWWTVIVSSGPSVMTKSTERENTPDTMGTKTKSRR